VSSYINSVAVFQSIPPAYYISYPIIQNIDSAYQLFAGIFVCYEACFLLEYEGNCWTDRAHCATWTA